MLTLYYMFIWLFWLSRLFGLFGILWSSWVILVNLAILIIEFIFIMLFSVAFVFVCCVGQFVSGSILSRLNINVTQVTNKSN